MIIIFYNSDDSSKNKITYALKLIIYFKNQINYFPESDKIKSIRKSTTQQL